MKLPLHHARRRGFTLIELLVVVSIIALLAALTMGGYTYAMNGSREKTTRGTFESVRAALDNYQSEFGEFPEAQNPEQQVEFVGKPYNIGGAACLYQALSGDGFDQIKGVTSSGADDAATPASDGKVSGTEEVSHVMLKEMPPTMWMRKDGVYILIDGFARPFQYVKATSTAGGDEATTINSTYDLWSYSMDQDNTNKRSIDTLASPKTSIKWIKNW